jgi:NDP-sugar pyrophosphorylase family protein
MDGDRVTGLREKPQLVSRVNSGIYVLEPDLLVRIPAGTPYPITNLVEDCLERGERVGGVPITEEWMDVGHPADLSRARGKE